MGRDNKATSGNHQTATPSVEALQQEVENLRQVNAVYKRQVEELLAQSERIGIKHATRRLLGAVKRSLKHRVINLLWYKSGYENTPELAKFTDVKVTTKKDAEAVVAAIVEADKKNIKLVVKPNKIRQAFYYRLAKMSKRVRTNK